MHSCKKDGIIEEDTMAQIYAEMLLTDQWINTTPGMRTVADTSLVYEPILKEYGYTSSDYRKSVEYYLEDPDTYADIMKATVKILDGKLKDLNKVKFEQEEQKKRIQFVKSMSGKLNLKDSLLAITQIRSNFITDEDSLAIEWDNSSMYFRIFKVRDTLSVKDSLQVLDTVEVLDKSEKGLLGKNPFRFNDSRIVKKKL
jgi:hypothetical protein